MTGYLSGSGPAPDSAPEPRLPTGDGPETRNADTPVAEREAPDFSRLLRARELWQVGLRSLLLQALWNPERMQGQGFAFSLRPVARRLLGPDGEAGWLARQMGYFNTNPPLSGCALGVVSRVEAEAVDQAGGADAGLEHLKAALGATLAARGDSFFWTTLRPLAAVIGVLWMLEGSPYGPLIFLVLYNGFHLYARMRGVFQGARRGLGWLNVWVRTRLDRIRVVMQATGVIACAVLINVVLDTGLAEGGPTMGMWMGVGVAVGMIWGDKRRLSPVALGIGIFTLALAWATLDR
jgi:PTS system mannose-specific IID component